MNYRCHETEILEKFDAENGNRLRACGAEASHVNFVAQKIGNAIFRHFMFLDWKVVLNKIKMESCFLYATSCNKIKRGSGIFRAFGQSKATNRDYCHPLQPIRWSSVKIVNKYLMKKLISLGFWNADVRNRILHDRGVLALFPNVLKIYTRLCGKSSKRLFWIWPLTVVASFAKVKVWMFTLPSQVSVNWYLCISMLGSGGWRRVCSTCAHA